MKRPQGFDDRGTRARAGRPGVPAGGGSGAVDPEGPGGASATRTADGRGRFPSPPSRDRAVTEPIELPDATVAEAPPVGGAASGAPGAPLLGDPAAAGDPEGPAAASAGPAPARPSDERAARRALAAAARDRRRYERQEVRRFTKRSRMRRFAWLVGIGSIVALVAVAVIAAYSPLMALRAVRIEGAQRIPAEQLRAAFDDELGTPLPLVTSDDVLESLGGFPLIETFSTETIPPDTLVVRIVERTPVGVIEASRGLELVDAAGVVIDRPDARPEGMPLIQVDDGVTSEGFRAAASVVRSLPAEVRSQLELVTAATADDVRFTLVGGAGVVWGSADESVLKATVLARLMSAAPAGDVSRYDVSAPMSPVTG